MTITELPPRAKALTPSRRTAPGVDKLGSGQFAHGHQTSPAAASHSITFGTWEEAEAYVQSLADDQIPHDAHAAVVGTKLPARQLLNENHSPIASGDQLGGGQPIYESHKTLAPATDFPSGQYSLDHQWSHAAGEPNPDMIGLYAAVLDDLEKVRDANENRLRAFTQDHGFEADHPDVLALVHVVASIRAAHDAAVKTLEKAMKRHPLGGWVARTRGLGLKQTARMLAAIGDPYWNDLHDRPRTKAELRQFCGWGDPGQRLRKGERVSWSPEARKRVWLIADKMNPTKGHYRPVYLAGREHYAEALHEELCPRCGPKGKPALPGSPLSDSHKHQRSLRLVCKAILNDLWDEASRLHLDQSMVQEGMI